MWTVNTLKGSVCNWEDLTEPQITAFLEVMNTRFPPDVFEDHLGRRRNALAAASSARNALDGCVQKFPETVSYRDVRNNFDDMRGCAVVFTAGGEGERLRLSLLDGGVPEEALRDFTKATYPLSGFFEDFGALQINLAMVGRICREYNIDIPVIITTGPRSSVTHRVIPAILEKHDYFGLSHVKIAAQDERLHFTTDEKIAVRLTEGNPYPVTHPDETGGPLMKLKQSIDGEGRSALRWLSSLNCEKLLVVQGTAIYEPKMLSCMAAASKGHDCVGVGISRAEFSKDDPFGTFVAIERGGDVTTCIIEQNIRNDETRIITNKETGEHLPFNTGLYAIDRKLLEDNDLPDYATPPKEILPGLPRSPKVGYAATDILPLAGSPLILTVDPGMYAVIKTAEDLSSMTETAVRFGLREMCSR